MGTLKTQIVVLSLPFIPVFLPLAAVLFDSTMCRRLPRIQTAGRETPLSKDVITLETDGEEPGTREGCAFLGAPWWTLPASVLGL